MQTAVLRPMPGRDYFEEEEVKIFLLWNEWFVQTNDALVPDHHVQLSELIGDPTVDHITVVYDAGTEVSDWPLAFLEEELAEGLRYPEEIQLTEDEKADKDAPVPVWNDEDGFNEWPEPFADTGS